MPVFTFQITPSPMGRLGLGSEMRVSARFQIIPRHMDRLVLGLGSGMRASASFKIIPRHVDRLGLGSGMRVNASFYFR